MRIVITAGGEEYPCSPSMGAMVRFRQETGKEIDRMDETSLTETSVWAYCCTASACVREKKEFPFKDHLDFADHVDISDLIEWKRISDSELAKLAETGADGDDEKKSPPAS